MRASPLIEALPGDFSMTLVDVGSAGGLNARWKPFASVISAVLFDPREPAPTGSFGPGEIRVYPVALGDRAGEAELHLTSLANMSSFLRPITAAFAPYGAKAKDASVTSTELVPIERLDTLARQDKFRPDVLKIDTQGSEMLVLEGASQTLRSVLLAEIEVSFFSRYEGQPLFADIQAFMEKQGFALIDLLELKRYRASNSLGIRNAFVPEGERSGRVAYGNAIFVRNHEEILKAAHDDGGATLLRTIVALVAYGKADIAARLLDQGRDSLAKGQFEKLGHALQASRSGKTGLLRRLLGRTE